MSSIRIIPSLLYRSGRLVKGKKFDKHIDCGDPVKTCLAFEGQTADEISIIDLGAYERKTKPNFEILKKINDECNTPISFGGNIQKIEDVENAIWNGADKVIINSNINNSKLISEIINKFGSQALIGSVDITKIDEKYKIFQNKNILEGDVFDYIKKINASGVGEIKITYVHKEGTGEKFELDISNKILKFVNVPVIFEGGFADLNDIKQAAENNIKAIALGRMLIYADNNIFKIKQYLQNHNFEVRLRN
tara:strand:- start:2206 stop:2955 length:750 start_codon:yes stop_codon:yes gene_type:complete